MEEEVKAKVLAWLKAKEELNQNSDFSSFRKTQADTGRWQEYRNLKAEVKDLAKRVKGKEGESRLLKLVVAYDEMQSVAADNPKNMLNKSISPEKAAVIMWQLEDAEMDLAREVGFSLTPRDEVLQKAFPNLE